MQIHSVLVHPNDQSLNAHLFSTALSHFEKQGHQTTITDVFKSADDIHDFLFRLCYTQSPTTSNSATASNYVKNYSKEFKDRSNFIDTEIQQIKSADLLFVQCPIWIWSLPAMFKSYCECVFFPGEIFLTEKPWDQENFKIHKYMTGKKVLFSLTMGSCQSMAESVVGSVENLIHPIRSMFEFVGYQWIEPHITWGTTDPCDPSENLYISDFQKFLDHTISA